VGAVLSACVEPIQDESRANDMIDIEEFKKVLSEQLPLKSAQALNKLVEKAIMELRLPVTAKYMQFTKLFEEVGVRWSLMGQALYRKQPPHVDYY
jgi:hypothetical protein